MAGAQARQGHGKFRHPPLRNQLSTRNRGVTGAERDSRPENAGGNTAAWELD